MSNFDELQDNTASENTQNSDGREGYRSFNRDNNQQNGEGRPRRQRIVRTDHAYTANQNEGFRPASFTAILAGLSKIILPILISP